VAISGQSESDSKPDSRYQGDPPPYIPNSSTRWNFVYSSSSSTMVPLLRSPLSHGESEIDGFRGEHLNGDQQYKELVSLYPQNQYDTRRSLEGRLLCASPDPMFTCSESSLSAATPVTTPQPVSPANRLLPPHLAVFQSTGCSPPFSHISAQSVIRCNTDSPGQCSNSQILHDIHDGTEDADADDPDYYNQPAIKFESRKLSSGPFATVSGPADPVLEERAAPYAHVIYDALMKAPDHRLVLSEIYEYFTRRFKKPKGNGWKNSIRHNLSMNGVRWNHPNTAYSTFSFF
jgi:hypothetical protein